MIVDAGRNLPVSAFTKIGTKPALFGRAWIWFDTVSTADWKKNYQTLHTIVRQRLSTNYAAEMSIALQVNNIHCTV